MALAMGHGAMAAMLGGCLKDIRCPETVQPGIAVAAITK